MAPTHRPHTRGSALSLAGFLISPSSPQKSPLPMQWWECFPSSLHCISHLASLPPVGLVDRVARLLSLMFNEIPLEGSSDSHVQAQIMPGYYPVDKQVSRTPVCI